MPTGIYKRTKKHKRIISEGCKKNGVGKWMKGRKRSEETKRKMSETHKGEKHWNWKGGITPERIKSINSLEYKKWRIAVFTRDGFACLNCGKVGVYLESHHIKDWADFPELRLVIDNGATLCNDCHNLTKDNRHLIKKEKG